jgi:hypothetical protein
MYQGPLIRPPEISEKAFINTIIKYGKSNKTGGGTGSAGSREEAVFVDRTAAHPIEYNSECLPCLRYTNC